MTEPSEIALKHARRIVPDLLFIRPETAEWNARREHEIHRVAAVIDEAIQEDRQSRNTTTNVTTVYPETA